MKELFLAVALRGPFRLHLVLPQRLHPLGICNLVSRRQNRLQHSQLQLLSTARVLVPPEACISVKRAVSLYAVQTQPTNASGHGGHVTAPTSEDWELGWEKVIRVRNVAEVRNVLTL